jgi:geranylgeranyl diphosphate synthase, type I
MPVSPGMPTSAAETAGRGRPQAAAREALRRTRVLLDPALRAWVERLPGPVARVASYHFGWLDGEGRPVDAPAGKALRPALVFGCAEAVGGTAEAALAPAVAVELVHNFSLLHDDILDRDTTRRHRPTAWAVFGTPAALLAGDALLSHAGRVLGEQPAPACAGTGVKWLSEAAISLIEGEQTDLSFEERPHVSLSECLAMAERKTAALLACSCALGALWGGGSPEQTEALRRFGGHLGMAFQLVDDMLGIWGDPEVTGKPAGADLVSRKKSLPVVAALDSGTPAGHRLAEMYASPGAAGSRPDEVSLLAELVVQAGGRSWAEETAEAELRLALECLRAAAPTAPAAASLTALARLACRRDR